MGIEFWLNGQLVGADVAPHTTLLDWLREDQRCTGTKEGCAEGDCGACTVALLDTDAGGAPVWRAINSCLTLLPMVHGRQVVTVEGLADGEALHPAQSAMVEHLGSQCGYCTPGFVMSLFEATYRGPLDDAGLDDQICGNLCRCTGYRPIRDAAREVSGLQPADAFSRAEPAPLEACATEVPGHRWEAPTELADVLTLLAEHPDAQLIAGATDLGLQVTKQGKTWPLLVSLGRVAALRELSVGPSGLRIGGATALTDLEDWSRTHSPPIARMLRYFGSRQIKHRGTIGGNLCNASPIGDLAPVLLSLGASVELVGPQGTRVLPLEQFFLGYRQTALQRCEVLAAVLVPPQPAGSRHGAYKVCRRREMDISAVSLGGRVSLQDGVVTGIRLAFGGMAATPARALQTEAALMGQPWTEDAVRAAQVLAHEFTPLSDHRGSAWYRSQLALNLLLGFVDETQHRTFTELGARPLSSIVSEAP